MDRTMLRRLLKKPAVRAMIAVIAVLAVVLAAETKWHGGRQTAAERPAVDAATGAVSVSDTAGDAAGAADAAGTAAGSGAAGGAAAGAAGNAEAGAGTDGASPAAESGAISEKEIVEESVPAGEISITISAAGDVTLGNDEYMDYDMSFNAKYEEVGDPAWFLAGVHDVFATDDLTIVNFEGTLTSAGERADKTYAFKADPSFVEILTSGSVEAANLANNHSFDYGRDAYEETKAVLEDAGVVTFGFDRSQVIDVRGIKVGLVGTYELEEELDCMDGMLEQIAWVKEQGARLIIVSFHWGDEGYYEITDNQVTLAHAAIDAGANLVLGHHPHVLQGVGHYHGAYICYSLGNFCFGGNADPYDKDTMIFRQTFTFVDGELQDTDEHLIIPCRISSTSDYNNYRPTILEGEEERRVLEKIEDLL